MDFLLDQGWVVQTKIGVTITVEQLKVGEELSGPILGQQVVMDLEWLVDECCLHHLLTDLQLLLAADILLLKQLLRKQNFHNEDVAILHIGNLRDLIPKLELIRSRILKVEI
jgi:hypothetical protein